ncbi:hypothetical protein T05_6540 [Trichinella murrelli]|uniref:Uncharacterized protein n=1 Tax=Trichinella murrelli TaxID=144512 RepID=A0A0V0T694_9BILA|nr:hypothetical protein T05_6540 [Trichinella murrelli]
MSCFSRLVILAERCTYNSKTNIANNATRFYFVKRNSIGSNNLSSGSSDRQVSERSSSSNPHYFNVCVEYQPFPFN